MRASGSDHVTGQSRDCRWPFQVAVALIHFTVLTIATAFFLSPLGKHGTVVESLIDIGLSFLLIMRVRNYES